MRLQGMLSIAKRRSTGGRTANEAELPFQNDASPIAASHTTIFNFEDAAKNSKREHQTILEENSNSLADNTIN